MDAEASAPLDDRAGGDNVFAVKGGPHAMEPERLEYAQRPALVDRLGPRRVVVYAIVCAALLSAFLAYEPVVRRVKQWQARRAYLERERQCNTFTAPADRVVYEEDPGRAAALAARDSAYLPVQTSDAKGSGPAPPFQPPVRREEPIWGRYVYAPRYNGDSQRGLVFLHERTSKSGRRRLVAIEVTAQLNQMPDGSWGITRFLACAPNAPDSHFLRTGKSRQFFPDDPTTTSSPGDTGGLNSELLQIDADVPRPADSGVTPLSGDPAAPYGPPFPLRLYAGQPDPNDKSRFTIEYDLRGRRGVITGVLNDDGAVVLTPDAGRHEHQDGWRDYAVWVPERTGATTTTSPAR